MEFAVNVPTSIGASEASTFPLVDRIRWEEQRSFARSVEARDFDGVAVPDHLMTGDGPTMECLTTLTGLAEATDELYLYPKTVNNHLRHGPLLAKIGATIDHVSDGRLKLGMGAGWKADEAKAYGYEWPSAPERLREMEETIELMKELWTTEQVTFEGDYYDIDGATCTPHPRQEPHPPIMVGGPGEEFTLRIAAKHADTWNCWGSVAFFEHKLSVLQSHCETYDRDYESIEKSWFGRCIIRETEAEVEALLNQAPRFKPENQDDDITHLVGTPETIVTQIMQFQALGVDEIVVEFIDFPTTDGLSLFADRVIPEF